MPTTYLSHESKRRTIGKSVTDAELRDAAIVELKKTTQGYLKSSGQPRALEGAQWKKGLALLAQIGQVPTGHDLPTRKVVLALGDKATWLTHDSPTTQIVPGGVWRDKHRLIVWDTAGGMASALYSGKLMYSVHGFRLIDGKPHRMYDWHNQPDDSPWGWTPPGSGGGVAPLAIDYPSTVGSMRSLCLCTQAEQDAGRPWQHEILSEAEIEALRGQWVWLWVEIRLGRPGSVRVWVNGALQLDKQGVNTHYHEEHQVTFWEGAYNSNASTACTVEIAATRFGRTPQEAYEDKPVFYTCDVNSPASSCSLLPPRKSTEAAIPAALS